MGRPVRPACRGESEPDTDQARPDMLMLYFESLDRSRRVTPVSQHLLYKRPMLPAIRRLETMPNETVGCDRGKDPSMQRAVCLAAVQYDFLAFAPRCEVDDAPADGR